MTFTISETDEILVSHSGLALAGSLLQRSRIQDRANAIRLGDRKRPEVAHGDDGYAPIFAYLAEGYLIHCQLRQGSQHCQEGTPQFLQEALGYARRITQAKLLVRMDAGNDDVENMRRCRKEKVDWIIKRNLRQESLDDWLEEAQAHGDWEFPREGKGLAKPTGRNRKPLVWRYASPSNSWPAACGVRKDLLGERSRRRLDCPPPANVLARRTCFVGLLT